MYTKGHIGFSLLAYSPFMYLLVVNGFPFFALFGFIFVGGFSTLPDLDQNLPYLTHRGISHSIGSAVTFGVTVFILLALIFSFAAIFLVPLGSIVGAPPMVIFAFFGVLGVFVFMTHFLADLLTPSGVRILRPISNKKYGLGLVYASNPIANIALWLMGWISILLVILLLIGTFL